MDKTFDARSVEAAVARKWDGADSFHAEPGNVGTPYCIVIPPPNVTAALHLGHALNNTLQDILVRWRRMCGDNAVWMPGTDHAGITTQTIVDRRLIAEGKPALKDFKKLEAAGQGGREKFIEKVQAWKDEYEATITAQLKAMGCSCDWARQRFTMDEVSSRAVREAFFQLFKAGLIYRGKRLVNWDPATQTALADDEVEMREVEGRFYYLKYPIVEEGSGFGVQGSGEGSFVTVATTRPETFLGDTAIAVNPKDPERAKFIGKFVKLPLVGRVIPIIGDDYVVIPDAESDDPKAKYTSGFLKVTPAHDPNDWEIGLRHGLAAINVLGPDGSVSDKHGWSDVGEAGFVVGMDRFEARKAIVKWFEEQGLLAETKPYSHSVGHSYRSHAQIEPYLSDQWYVKVTDERLAGAALKAMAEEQRSREQPSPQPSPKGRGGKGELRFYPERYAKTFEGWHENIRDWCISRQLWWGHRIPVWSKVLTVKEGYMPDEYAAGLANSLAYSGDTAVISVSAEGNSIDWATKNDPPPDGDYVTYICLRNDGASIKPEYEIADVTAELTKSGFSQDPDVLDTWFSSALWPISTLGWPGESQISDLKSELNTWNPSNVLCTAREIITLWVSRMVMFNLFLRGCLPFKDVFIHAMIQDGEGQKMSKSLGNGVDPLDIIHSHGADAMRFTLAAMTTQTQDVRMPVDAVCPHCSEAFHPKTKKTSHGYTVAVPTTECPKCRKKMTTSFGVASGEAKANDAVPAARNTSSKFDQGRNFTNKVWNAARFVLQKSYDSSGAANPKSEIRNPNSSLPDRWILSRLARTIRVVEESLSGYEFKGYADALYDFFWRDYCDWYVEAVKPDAPGSFSQGALAAVLDASMRLMHPVMPFLTEGVWEHLNSWGEDRSILGLKLEPGVLCVKARWPVVEEALIDDEAERAFELIRHVVTAVRNVRSEHNVPPRQRVTVYVKAVAGDSAVVKGSAGLLATLANAELNEAGEHVKPAEGAVAVSLGGGVELFLEGVVDTGAEKDRTSRRADEIRKTVAALKGRLGNPGYADKAPAHLVEQTRKQLAEAERELESLEKKLASNS